MDKRDIVMWWFDGEGAAHAQVVNEGDAKALGALLEKGARRSLPQRSDPMPKTVAELAEHFDLAPPWSPVTKTVSALAREIRAFGACAVALGLTSVALPLPFAQGWSRPLRREELPGEADERDVALLLDAVGEVFGFDARRAQADALATSGAAS